MGYAKKEEEERKEEKYLCQKAWVKNACQRAWRKEKKEKINKDSPYFQIEALIQIERDSWLKGVPKIFRIRKVVKNSTLCTSWSKCMTCISLWSGFWLSNICDASMPTSHSDQKLHSKALVVGYEKEGKFKCLGEVSYTFEQSRESFEELIFLCKNLQNLRIDGQSKTNDWWFYYDHSILQPPKNLEKLYAPQGSR
jgi:hypothetical protein